MKNHKQTFVVRGEKGAALITSIFALLLVTMLGMALMAVGEIARTVSTNDRENTEALYLADSGIAHARKLISNFNPEAYDSILTAGDGTANTGDELSTALFASPITAESGGGRTFGFGSYVVRVTDDDDEAVTQNRNDDRNRRIILRSIGRGRNGATATVEIAIHGSLSPGLVVDGNLRINGNSDFVGSAGGVHANGNLQISGNPRAEQFFSASGTLTVSGSPRTGPSPFFGDSPADLRTGDSPRSIPVLTPTNFRAQADYILGTDGKIRNQAGTQLGSSGSWNNWDYDTGKREWKNGSNSFPSGTYYAEGGSIAISGSPGTVITPITLSLIADGYVEISGNPTMVPDIPYAVIAGTDLKVNGNPLNPYIGTFYAGHQVAFSGNPAMNGQVLAKNLADTSWFGTNVVQLSSGYMEISGDLVSSYSGFGTSTVLVTSWREVRN